MPFNRNVHGSTVGLSIEEFYIERFILQLVLYKIKYIAKITLYPGKNR